MPKKFLSFFLILSVFFTACDKNNDDNNNNPVNPVQPGDNDHILLGNPTNATPNAGNGGNYFKDNIYYKLAYSSSRGIPVWVSWHLQSSDVGTTPRQDDFRPDNLPSSYYAVSSSSYNSSGFDRGHNVPSADRTSSVPANSSTFLMTNIIPQAPNFNQGPWEGLEDFIRNTLVGNNNEAFIVMGNWGAGGKGSGGTVVNTIDNGNVTVPSTVWKVVVVIPKSNDDLNRVSSSATLVAVEMPNDNTLYTTSGKDVWKNYTVKVRDLETHAAAAGVSLNLFSALPAAVANALKDKPRYQ
jgi:endonuclease G, mitochondrial